MQFEDYLAKTRFANLDGVRFLSISAVIWHHGMPDTVQTASFLGRGFLGVDFFFVLSGFLITTLLLREQRETGSISLKGFYLKRILRILPVYLFVVGMVSTYYILIKGEWEYTRLLPFYVVFLNNFLVEHIPLLSVTWSLAVEEHFYLVWPLMLVLLPPRSLVPVASLVIALNVAGIMGLFGASSLTFGPLHFALPSATYAPIIMGAVLAVMLDRKPWFDRISLLLRHPSSALIFFFLLLVVIYFAPADIRGFPNLVIHSLMAAMLAALVVREKNTGLGWLQNRLVARIGVISYGVYLYHLIALDITVRLFAKIGIEGGFTILITYYAVSYLMSELSFRTLEAYFRKFRPQT